MQKGDLTIRLDLIRRINISWVGRIFGSTGPSAGGQIVINQSNIERCVTWQYLLVLCS